MTFEYFPGDHFTVSTPEYRKAADHFLITKYLDWEKVNKKGF